MNLVDLHNIHFVNFSWTTLTRFMIFTTPPHTTISWGTSSPPIQLVKLNSSGARQNIRKIHINFFRCIPLLVRGWLKWLGVMMMSSPPTRVFNWNPHRKMPRTENKEEIICFSFKDHLFLLNRIARIPCFADAIHCLSFHSIHSSIDLPLIICRISSWRLFRRACNSFYAKHISVDRMVTWS